MITEEEYEKAKTQHEESEKIINQYHMEKRQRFEQRMKDNPVFTDDELFYSARDLCPCGHGLAYPKDCSPNHYWDCSAILKGIADKTVEHCAQLPFAYYSIKGESKHNGTTRGVFIPKKDKE